MTVPKVKSGGVVGDGYRVIFMSGQALSAGMAFVGVPSSVGSGVSVIRLVGAVLAEQHDERTEGRRYLGLDVLARCRLRPVTDTGDTSEEVSNPTIPALSA